LSFDNGNSQTNLRRNEVLACPIIIPPLTLQQEFADKIEAIEKQKELIKQSIAETETLFNSRMNYYFN
jgi:type I restriction enzyme S subunit